VLIVLRSISVSEEEEGPTVNQTQKACITVLQGSVPLEAREGGRLSPDSFPRQEAKASGGGGGSRPRLFVEKEGIRKGKVKGWGPTFSGGGGR